MTQEQRENEFIKCFRADPKRTFECLHKILEMRESTEQEEAVITAEEKRKYCLEQIEKNPALVYEFLKNKISAKTANL